jgi:hypothetical protein
MFHPSDHSDSCPIFKSWCQVETEVSKVVNKTTLGLYSFFFFVDSLWSVQRNENKHLPCHLSFTAGNARCKRLRAETIVKSGAPLKRQKVNMVKGMKRILTSIKGGRPDGWCARPCNIFHTFFQFNLLSSVRNVRSTILTFFAYSCL